MVNFTVLDLIDLDLKEHNFLKLKCVAGRAGLSQRINDPKLSRPGLPLSGYFKDFSTNNIQLFGKGEQSYVHSLEENNDYASLERIFKSNIPCCIFSDDGKPSSKLIDLAEENATPILTTSLDSSIFSRRAYALLDEVFAETETIHGVLVEVFGVGVLITGDSGVGKSETALELLERGHRIISDDTVKLINISDTMLMGTGENPMLAHHMEIRGIGIINITNLFGASAIRDKKHIQLSVQLEAWDTNKDYDRIGDNLTDTYLGVTIPKVEIPVKPGRNIPLLIETAARNERLKKLGIYSAKEFDKEVITWLEGEAAKRMYYNSDMDEDSEYDN